MKRILLLSLMFSLTFAFSALAQRTVSGTVTSADDGSTVPGVNVVLKGTTTGTTTDLDGNYRLSVPEEGGTLVYSFIGLSQQEVQIGARSVIDVAMQSDVQQLTEVVVTGAAPGITTKTLGYSLGKVDENLIQQAPGVDAAQALQGKVAGVKVIQNGAPGSNAGIRLRGSTSLYEGQQPLVVVDGVIVDGGLNTINSEDIESIEILKSSSAAALYGSRGANGVIVINTRRGANMKEGDVRIVFRNEVGRNYLPGRIDLAETHHYEIDSETGAPPVGNQVPRADQLSVVPYPNPQDYQDILFQEEAFYTNYLSISGRTDKANFMLSAQNTNQPGVVYDTDGQSRQNFKANFDYNLTDDLFISTSNFFSQREIDNAPTSVFFDALLFRPDLDLFAKVPDPNNPSATIINAKPDSSAQMVNPVYTLTERYSTTTDDRYIGSVGLNYSPFNFLTFEGFVGLDKQWSTTENIVPLGYLADDVAFQRIGAGGMDVTKDQTTQVNVRGNVLISKTFGDLALNSRIGYWFERNQYDYTQVNGDGFTFDRRTLENIQTVSDVDQFKSEVQSENMLIQIGGVYQDKISLDLLGRRDAVSLFGPEARTSNNYRVAASYRISEDFDIPGIQEFKIRAARATSGVWPRYSAQYETFNVTAGVATKDQLGNENLKPAIAIENEFGINMNLLNKFTLDVSYVMNNTTDQIIQVPLPAVVGFGTQWQNAGDLEYRGLEITLGANVVDNPNFRWDFNVVFDRFKQEITNLPIPEFRRGTGIQQSDVFLIKEGEPLGAIYATKWMRSLDEVLDGNPEADLSDYAINNEGFVVRANQLGTGAEVPLPYVDAEGATTHKVGDTNPDFNLGINNTFTIYKNLTVYFLWDWKQGGDIYSQTLQFLTRDNRAGYMDQRGSAYPKSINYYQGFYNTNNPSSYFVYDGSYLKLRELSINYNIPGTLFGEGFGNAVENIRLGLVGRNLLIISDYPGYDPEVGQGPDNIDRTTYALDGFRYPNFRTFSGSIQITF